ncbi:MAG: ATP-binding protein [Desulfuromonas sp.]|nr:ATP-binding protein [Desulfuromonas sp.]
MSGNTQSENLIIIVEDSPTQAEQLQYLLTKNDYKVKVASNGIEALAHLEECRPLAVISDIVMPEMDGYELCRQIKSNPDLQGIPVILLTSLSEPDDVIIGLESGADYFIIKPYKEKYLLSRLHYIIANRHLGSGDCAQMGLEIFFRERKYFINSDRLQILNLLLSTYETAIQKNQELQVATEELQLLNEQLVVNLNALETQNHELDRLNRELRCQTEEAGKARSEALEATRAKSDFLANMSHELRTPLNSVIGFSEVLEDEIAGPLNVKQGEYVKNILFSGRHLLSLINDILDLSKVEAGHMVLEPVEVDVTTLLQTSLNMLQEKALKNGISLGLDVSIADGTVLLADQRKLKQIIFNLLSNAVKFTTLGGEVKMSAHNVQSIAFESPDIWEPEQPLELQRERAGIQISVTDSGIGIDREDFPKLFQEFSQLSSPYTKEHEGTGLGLALSKRLVELHGGRIGVWSEVGRGSMFTFVIPVTPEE